MLITRRPRYGCRACEGAVAQAPVLTQLIEGGIPTEMTVAQVLASKYADHLPLYHQAQIYARQGVHLDRSTLADWVGRAAFLLRPVYDLLHGHLKASTKLFADGPKETNGSVGRRAGSCSSSGTHEGRATFRLRPGRSRLRRRRSARRRLRLPSRRKAERPIADLQGFIGVLQLDGYGGYKVLTDNYPTVTFNGFFAEGYVLEPGSAAEEILVRAHEGAVGAPLRSFMTPGYLDTRVYGLYGRIPSLRYGPVSRNSYGSDECVSPSLLQRITGTMALFIAEWCGTDSASQGTEGRHP